MADTRVCTRPQTLQDLVDQTSGRALDLFDLEAGTFPRWGEAIVLTKPAKRRAVVDTGE